MFQKHSKSGYTLAVPGIEQKTLVHGERTLMAEFLLKKGGRLPQHSHPHEQTGYLVNGLTNHVSGREEAMVLNPNALYRLGTSRPAAQGNR